MCTHVAVLIKIILGVTCQIFITEKNVLNKTYGEKNILFTIEMSVHVRTVMLCINSLIFCSITTALGCIMGLVTNPYS
jgi:hypothetical protein